MKKFLLSELREFAVILKEDDKDEMLRKFKAWYRDIVYEFCRREQIYIILRNHYGSVDEEWNGIDIRAEQNYRHNTQEAFPDVYGRYKWEWFEQIYDQYRQWCLTFKDLRQNGKWYDFFKLWKAVCQLKKADSYLTLRDLLQVAGYVYISKGGSLRNFKVVMST